MITLKVFDTVKSKASNVYNLTCVTTVNKYMHITICTTQSDHFQSSSTASVSATCGGGFFIFNDDGVEHRASTHCTYQYHMSKYKKETYTNTEDFHVY